MYPTRDDLKHLCFYVCECGSRVGTYRRTLMPLGVPADERTRKARMAAHRIFDPLWRKDMWGSPADFPNRGAAYKWLAEKFGVPVVHIGEMTAEQAHQVVRFVRER